MARGKSHQEYHSRIHGNEPLHGALASATRSSTDDGDGGRGARALTPHHGDAALIHEAAIGKIAGEQILKLRTLGLTEQEAEARIIEGFLS